MHRFRKFLTTSAIVVASALVANATSAAEIFIDKGGIYGAVSTKVVGPGVNSTDLAGEFYFDVNKGIGPGSPQYRLYAFCVALYNSITVGINKQSLVNLQYHESLLTDDGHGTVLSLSQINQIQGLANWGYHLRNTGAVDLFNKLDAIQVAIWRIEYPLVTVTPQSAVVQAYATGFQALAPSLNPKGAYTLVPDYRPFHQSFIIGGAVPEPATWALMITGMGLAGVALRRRRPATVSA